MEEFIVITRRTFTRLTAGIAIAAAIPIRASAQTPPPEELELLTLVDTLYNKGWNAHDPNVVFDIIAADHVYNDPITPGIGTGPKGYFDLMTTYLGAFPDINFPIHALVPDTENQIIGVRWSADATQDGPIFGIPATHKHLRVPAMAIHTITEGKISHTFVIYDTLGMVTQLGLIPPTGSNPASTPEAALIVTMDGTPGPILSPALAATKARDFYNKIWNDQNPAITADLVTPDFQYIDPAVPTLPKGPQGYEALVSSFLTGIPDLTITIDTVASNGNAVAMHWTGTGTQTGEFLGIPATGKKVTAQAISFLTFKDSLISTNWSVFDALGILIQLGAIPPLGGGDATPGS